MRDMAISGEKRWVTIACNNCGKVLKDNEGFWRLINSEILGESESIRRRGLVEVVRCKACDDAWIGGNVG